MGCGISKDAVAQPRKEKSPKSNNAENGRALSISPPSPTEQTHLLHNQGADDNSSDFLISPKNSGSPYYFQSFSEAQAQAVPGPAIVNRNCDPGETHCDNYQIGEDEMFSEFPRPEVESHLEGLQTSFVVCEPETEENISFTASVPSVTEVLGVETLQNQVMAEEEKWDEGPNEEKHVTDPPPAVADDELPEKDTAALDSLVKTAEGKTSIDDFISSLAIKESLILRGTKDLPQEFQESVNEDADRLTASLSSSTNSDHIKFLLEWNNPSSMIRSPPSHLQEVLDEFEDKVNSQRLSKSNWRSRLDDDPDTDFENLSSDNDQYQDSIDFNHGEDILEKDHEYKNPSYKPIPDQTPMEGLVL